MNTNNDTVYSQLLARAMELFGADPEGCPQIAKDIVEAHQLHGDDKENVTLFLVDKYGISLVGEAALQLGLGSDQLLLSSDAAMRLVSTRAEEATAAACLPLSGISAIVRPPVAAWVIGALCMGSGEQIGKWVSLMKASFPSTPPEEIRKVEAFLDAMKLVAEASIDTSAIMTGWLVLLSRKTGIPISTLASKEGALAAFANKLGKSQEEEDRKES